MTAAAGTSSSISPSRFATVSLPLNVMPVILPPGRLRLATIPNVTGSPPITKTMGIFEVAALAARIGQYDRLPALAADLVSRRVSVIVATAGTPTVCVTVFERHIPAF
jgi:hypothetical protein